MSSLENKVVNPSALEKKGGYTGSRPASSVPPPPKTPSATIRPAAGNKTQK